MHTAVLLAAIISIVGCGPTFDDGWTVTGAPVTAAYEREIHVAAEIIREQEGVLHRRWGGTIVVRDAPFPCGGTVCTERGCTTLCGGLTQGDGHTIEVVYAPAISYGPAVGSTAIEWELCQAARIIRTCANESPWNLGVCGGGDSDPEVRRCTIEATPKVQAALAVSP